MLRALVPGALWVVVAAVVPACSDDPARPEIIRFESNLSAVANGRPVQLSWETRNADRIDIVAQPDTLLLDGSVAATGRVVSPPIQRTTVFRLDATGGGDTVSATVRVTALGSSETVRVLELTAEPGAIRPGEASTLRWSSEGATSATLRTGDGIILTTNPSLPAGTFEVTPDLSTDYELELVGTGGIATASTRVVVLRPEIRELTVTPESIQRGDSAVIAWAVAQASGVRIEDESGAPIYEGDDLSGQVTVQPAATETYRLIATDGSEQAEASVVLTVTEPLEAEVVRFDADPTAVRLGETSTLTWEVRNASRGIVIRRGDEVLIEEQSPAGSIAIRPATSGRYDLVARSLGGDATASATVEVLPSPPAVLAFRAVPNPAVRGEEARLEWLILGADDISIARGGTLLADELEPAGALPITITSASESIRLTASNANGTTTRDLAVSSRPRPEILTFRSSPRSFASTPVRVTLNWSTRDATRLSLLANNAAVPGFPPAGYDPAGGQFELDINQTTLFELAASNPAATTRAQIIVGESAGEQEPNDTSATAGSLGSGGRIRGELDSGTDVDWYEVTVPLGGNVRIETSDGNQSCATDTRIRLFEGSDLTTAIIDRDGGGAGACALIDPALDPRAADLDGTTYYIELSGNGAIGSYVLDVTTGPAACPNGIRERSNREQCDDGAGGSATCDANCQRIFTPLFTVGANGSGTRLSTISPVGEREYVTVEVPAGGGFITARTWADRVGSCTAGTEIVLFDDNFDEIGRAVGSTFDNCAAIHPERQAFAAGPSGAGLAAGTYHLELGDAGDDELIANYVIEVASVAPGCGNEVLEASEGCDDGDSVSGDGCSASCAVEGTAESEPNDVLADATSVALAADDTATIQGRLSSSDIDWFTLTVPSSPAGLSLTATVSDGRGSCRAWSGGTDAVISVLDATATATLAFDQNRTEDGCAVASPLAQTGLRSLSAGTYHIVVEPGPFGVEGRYFVELALTPPVCGNAIQEGSEQCDDGNTSAQDGCDASCELEIADTIDFARTSTGSWSATLDPETFTVAELQNVPLNPALRVDVFDGGTTTCANGWAAVLLLDDQFEPATPLFSQSPGQCNPLPSNLTLTAGTYHLVVLNIDGARAEAFDIEVELGP